MTVLDRRRLYLCTPDRPDLSGFVASCIRGGVDVVQLREKRLADRDLVKRARVVGRVCRDYGVPFILNDRPDLVGDAGADGVHVGQDDPHPAFVRRVLGPAALIGLSTHAPHELAAARDQAVDYISVGPVVPTPSAAGRLGTGTGYVRHAAATAAVPWFVTGGVTPKTVGGLAAAGARRFVVVRWLVDSEVPEEAARQLRAAIEKALDLPESEDT